MPYRLVLVSPLDDDRIGEVFKSRLPHTYETLLLPCKLAALWNEGNEYGDSYWQVETVGPFRPHSPIPSHAYPIDDYIPF
jgi:hypothetical protein